MPNILTFAAQGSYNNLLKNRQICTNTVTGSFQQELHGLPAVIDTFLVKVISICLVTMCAWEILYTYTCIYCQIFETSVSQFP